MKAVAEAGGEPVVLSPVEDSEYKNILAQLDGVILLGGEHSHFGGPDDADQPTLVSDAPPTAERKAEIELAKEAVRKTKLPVLGICSGSQLINEVLGGNYEDHVRRRVELTATRSSGREQTTEVAFAAGSRLAEIYRRKSITVPILHHKNVKFVGDGLVSAGAASDGVVEAIESNSNRFLIGVNWHPEFDLEEHLPLFQSLVSAATRKQLQLTD
ncbi:MAG: gamma-glutamyl-gamma-aminobutyrate hydrolase family protein [Candidatus Obscuribacterales bacterium]|jgi:putative glutamine amidotransferase|nr:gamma-glutamyl-gamma-aminobutyrate hydrolase family protein [Candidatus Obscuribacterales bacterium]